jgi:hypothetical protein
MLSDTMPIFWAKPGIIPSKLGLLPSLWIKIQIFKPYIAKERKQTYFGLNLN